MVKRWVRQAQEELNDQRLQLIKSYYSKSWIQFSQLQFRYAKLFAYNASESSYYWISPARYANIKRLTAAKFELFVSQLLQMDIYPLRIFQSSCEWLNPDRVELPTHHQRYLLNAGIFAIECDTNLADSLENSQVLSQIVHDTTWYVFSGNKSVHAWIMNAELSSWIIESDQSSYENTVLQARQRYFEYLQQRLPHPTDSRTALDTRRILPMIGSLNALTGRIVTKLAKNEVATLSPAALRTKTTLIGWNKSTMRGLN